MCRAILLLRLFTRNLSLCQQAESLARGDSPMLLTGESSPIALSVVQIASIGPSCRCCWPNPGLYRQCTCERGSEIWWAHQDLNLEPKRYEHSALTN
jgi:hypothetical protein